MGFDVVIVLYNNSAWLPKCLAALGAVNYSKKLLHLFFVDNSPHTGETEQVLSQNSALLAAFGSIKHIKNRKNFGFGAACNIGATQGASDNIFFLNMDTEVDKEIFARLTCAIKAADENTAAFECRQLPCETGHHINPVTMQTTWASAAALVIRRNAFSKVGGFDKHLFMYCEDVDLCWRLRALGYTISYVPSVKVWHYSYMAQPTDNSTPAELQHIKFGEYTGGFYGNLLLRYKFGSLKQILQGHALYFRVLHRPMHFANIRKVLAKNYLKHLIKLWPFLFWRFPNRKAYKTHPARFEGGFAPDRGVYPLIPCQNNPLVSVLVRTCGRPEVLRQTLLSLRYQTYSNFEIIIVEDGTAQSREVCEDTLVGLNYTYYATIKKVGRGRVGNIALSMAKGEYCNFLDDDDYFYPDHLELLASQLAANPDADLVTAASMAMEIGVKSCEPYEFEVKSIFKIECERMDNFLLCQRCLMPIQSVMFKRELFEKYGGLHEKLNGNEDWYMWLKYFSHATRINPKSVDITRATSLFCVPANIANANKRLEDYRKYDAALWQTGDISFNITPQQMREYYSGILDDMRHLRRLGKLDEFLDENSTEDIVQTT